MPSGRIACLAVIAAVILLTLSSSADADERDVDLWRVYFPIPKIGTEWTYNVTLLSKTGSTVIRKMVITYEGETVFEGTKAHQFSWSTKHQAPPAMEVYRETRYLIETPEGLSLLGYEAKGPAGTSGYRFDPPMLFLSKRLSVGVLWEYTGIRSSATGRKGPYPQEAKVIGLETINVPAGRFNTIKIALTGGATDSGQKSAYWLAKSVGMIRREVEWPTVRETVDLVSGPQFRPLTTTREEGPKTSGGGAEGQPPASGIRRVSLTGKSGKTWGFTIGPSRLSPDVEVRGLQHEEGGLKPRLMKCPPHRRVEVIVRKPSEFSVELRQMLADDDIAKGVLEAAREYALAECPVWASGLLTVYTLAPGGVMAKFAPEAGAWVLKEYKNQFAEERRAQEAAEAKRREQAAQYEAAVRAEQAKKETDRRTAADELSALVRRWGATRLVACSQLDTNPFALEGQVVAVRIPFTSMLERDKALFAAEGMPACGIVASGVPSGTFSTDAFYAILAGRVVGKTDVKLPVGVVSLPHVKFVGVHKCRQKNCAEFWPE